MFSRNKWILTLLSGGLLLGTMAFHAIPRATGVKKSLTISAPPQSAWAAIIGRHVPLQGVRYQRTGPHPIALGWSYSPTNSLVGFSGLRVMRLVWRRNHWVSDGILRPKNTNFVFRSKSDLGPDHSIVLATEWASGGSDNAGAFVNVMATAHRLVAFRTTNVGVPGRITVTPLRIREMSATTVVRVQWSHRHWHQKTLGLLATIPSTAQRIHWSIAHGVVVIRPSSTVHIATNQMVAFIPPPTLSLGQWGVNGPFSSVATARKLIANDQVPAYLEPLGLVMQPPIGTSVWMVGTWTRTSTGIPFLHPSGFVTVIAGGT